MRNTGNIISKIRYPVLLRDTVYSSRDYLPVALTAVVAGVDAGATVAVADLSSDLAPLAALDLVEQDDFVAHFDLLAQHEVDDLPTHLPSLPQAFDVTAKPTNIATAANDATSNFIKTPFCMVKQTTVWLNNNTIYQVLKFCTSDFFYEL